MILIRSWASPSHTNSLHTMMQADTPYPIIATALAAASALNWVLFDRTKQGVALAAICAVGAPLSELVLLYFVPLWSYPEVSSCWKMHTELSPNTIRIEHGMDSIKYH